MNSNQRARFAGLLAIGATILLISILIGTHLGDRAIVAADGKSNDIAVDLPTPVPVSSASVPPASSKWKKSHVVAVATDPAFPDPRFTPTPAPTPTPTPKPTPSNTQEGDAPDPDLTDTPANAFPVRATQSPAPRRTKQPSTDELGE